MTVRYRSAYNDAFGPNVARSEVPSHLAPVRRPAACTVDPWRVDHAKAPLPRSRRCVPSLPPDRDTGRPCPGACDQPIPIRDRAVPPTATGYLRYDSGASGNTGAECNWPGNECAIRYCNGGHQCAVTPPSGSQNKPEGGHAVPRQQVRARHLHERRCVQHADPTVPRLSRRLRSRIVPASDVVGRIQVLGRNDAALSNPPPACNAVVLGSVTPRSATQRLAMRCQRRSRRLHRPAGQRGRVRGRGVHVQQRQRDLHDGPGGRGNHV